MATKLSDSDLTNFTFTLNRSIELGTYYTASISNTNIAGDIIIPSEYNGLPVKEIKASGTFDKSNITSITIPDSIKIIGDYAFSNCTSLTSIVIPDSVTSIKYYAFRGCSSLKNITIPNSIVTISNYVFYGCNSLTSLSIPNSVTSISSYSIYNCNNLETVIINANIKNIQSQFIVNCPNLTTIKFGDTAKSTIKTISSGAFQNCPKIKYFNSNTEYTFELPDNIETISSNAFGGGTLFKTVKIGTGLKSLNFKHFTNMFDNAKHISISQGNEHYISGNTNYIVEKETKTLIFSRATGEIEIPKNIESVNVEVIGINAFWGSTITKVIIPTDIKVISEYAFANCANLAVVEFTDVDDITDENELVIKEGAFIACSSLTSLVIPNRVKVIPELFVAKSGIRVITIGKNVETIIGETYTQSPFLGCDDLGTINITSGNKKFSIPDSCNCIIETATKKLVFGCASSTIPNNVKTIGRCAFQENCGILEIVIPANIELIEPYAYSCCEAAETITFEGTSKLKEIGDRAFFSVDKVDTVAIPDSVKTIGKYAFAASNSTSDIFDDSEFIYPDFNPSETITEFTEFAVNLNNPITDISIITNDLQGSEYESAINNINADKLAETFINSILARGVSYGIKNVTFGENSKLSILDDGAFYNCNYLESIILPKTLTKIGDRAFYNTNISTITIPASVKTIGKYAFYGCFNGRIEGNHSVHGSEISSEFNIDTSTKCSIIFDTGDAGSKLEEIGDYAFYGCSLLETLELPDSLETIGNSAFSNCFYAIYDSEGNIDSENSVGLVSVTFGNNIKTIGSSAFNNCQLIGKISVANDINKTFSDTLESIGYSAFSNCINLGGYLDKETNNYIKFNITIPDSVATIGSYAFYNCRNISTITLPKNKNFTEIGNYTFYYCTSLTSIDIPNSVETINSYAFRYCENLATLTLGENLKTINYCAFSECLNLKVINLNSKELDIYASTSTSNSFYNCTNVHTLNIGPLVETLTTSFLTYSYQNIGKNLKTITVDNTNKHLYLKNNCVIRKDIPVLIKGCGDSNGDCVIPKEVIDIDQYAFKGNLSLKNLTFEGGATESSLKVIRKNAFTACSNLITLETIPDSVRLIETGTDGAGAFQSCTALTALEFTENSKITIIGSYAFSGCSKLASVELPSDSLLTRLETCCFNYCAALTSIVIPNTVFVIDTRAFNYCTALKDITISDNCSYIGQYAFYNCNNIISITLPDSLFQLDIAAFAECDGLTEIRIPSGVGVIGNSVFSCCRKLKTVFLDSVNYIKPGASVFNECHADLKVYYRVDNIGYKPSIEDSNGVWTELWNGAKMVKQTDSVSAENDESANLQYIISEDKTFYYVNNIESENWNDNVKDIIIPDIYNDKPVRYICYNAFRNNSNITSVKIENNVKQIGHYAFNGCANLTTLSFKSIEDSELLAFNSYTFSNSFTGDGSSIEIPKKLLYIGTSVFNGGYNGNRGSSIKFIDFPTNCKLRYFGPDSFNNCNRRGSDVPDQLNKVTVFPEDLCILPASFKWSYRGIFNVEIGENVINIPNGANIFYYGGYLYSIKISENNPFYNSSKYNCSIIDNKTKELLVGSVIIKETVNTDGTITRTNTNQLKITEGVKSIGVSAGEYRRTLNDVDFTEAGTLKTIKNNAFYYSTIKTITGVIDAEEIGSADSGTSIWYENITGPIQFGPNVKTINTIAFRYINSNSASIVVDPANTVYTSRDLSGNECNCVIDIKSKTLVGGFRTTIIPNDGSVTSIGNNAFYANRAAVTINIPDSITSIGSGAFYNCYNTTSIVIGKNVSYIAGNAFAGFIGGAYVGGFSSNFPSGTWIAFPHQYQTNIIVDKENKYFTSSINDVEYNCIIRKNNLELVTAPRPKSVDENGNYIELLKNEQGGYIKVIDLTTDKYRTLVEIPNGIKRIGSYAFSYYQYMTDVIIPDSVEYIDSYAFQYCSRLSNVSISENNNLGYIGSYAFRNCFTTANQRINDDNIIRTFGLESFPFTNCGKLTDIGSYAFYECDDLIEIEIPYYVDTIGSYAFSGCNALKTVKLNNSGTIGASAFSGCVNLESVEFTEDNTVYKLSGNTFANCAKLTKFTLPNYLSQLENTTFTGCTGIETLNIPVQIIDTDCSNFKNDILAIGDFKPLTGLKTVNIINGLNEADYVTARLDSDLFVDNKSLTTLNFETDDGYDVNIDENQIGSYKTITKLEFGKNISNIPPLAFRNLINLEKIIIDADNESYKSVNNCVITINDKTPKDCVVLGCKNSVIPESVDSNNILSIGKGAFYGCIGLTSVEIPYYTETIGDRAFYGCTGLTEFTINSINFIDNNITELLKNTDNLERVGYKIFGIGYNEDELWNTKPLLYVGGQFKFILNDIGNEYSVGGVMTKNVTTSGNLSIPESFNNKPVTAILKDGFSFVENSEGEKIYFTGIENVTIPSSIEIINESAFAGSGVTKVTISENDGITIKSKVFANCTNLTTANIPNSTVRYENFDVGEYVFENCTKLTSVTVPTNIPNIPKGMFKGCKKLKKINNETILSNFGKLISVGAESFFNTGIVELVVPSNIAVIEKSAFEGCTKLKTVILENNVNIKNVEDFKTVLNVKDRAFTNCNILEEFYIKNNMVDVIDASFNTRLPDVGTALEGCAKLKYVYYDDFTIYGIIDNDKWNKVPLKFKNPYEGIYEFSLTDDRTSYVIRAADGVNITKMTKDAIDYDYDFLYSTLNDIGEYVTSPEDVSDIYINSDTNRIYIPPRYRGLPVSGIENNGFIDQTNIKSIDIFCNLLTIGNSAFEGCTALNELNTIDSYKNAQKIADSEDKLFVTIPDSVTYIGDSAFKGCEGIENIKVNATIYEILDSTFENCSKAELILIPGYISRIGNYAFKNCSILTRIDLPEDLTVIQEHAFDGCKKLTSVTIPALVDTIERGAFANCIGITNFKLNTIKEVLEQPYPADDERCVFYINPEFGTPKFDTVDFTEYGVYIQTSESDKKWNTKNLNSLANPPKIKPWGDYDKSSDNGKVLLYDLYFKLYNNLNRIKQLQFFNIETFAKDMLGNQWFLFKPKYDSFNKTNDALVFNNVFDPTRITSNDTANVNAGDGINPELIKSGNKISNTKTVPGEIWVRLKNFPFAYPIEFNTNTVINTNRWSEAINGQIYAFNVINNFGYIYYVYNNLRKIAFFTISDNYLMEDYIFDVYGKDYGDVAGNYANIVDKALYSDGSQEYELGPTEHKEIPVIAKNIQATITKVISFTDSEIFIDCIPYGDKFFLFYHDELLNSQNAIRLLPMANDLIDVNNTQINNAAIVKLPQYKFGSINIAAPIIDTNWNISISDENFNIAYEGAPLN